MSLSLEIEVENETKRTKGNDQSFFSTIKQENETKLLFFCHGCGKYYLFESRMKIEAHAVHCGGRQGGKKTFRKNRSEELS